MAKRSAEQELTKEYGFAPRDDDDVEESGRASADVLRRRPIANPIRRLGSNAAASPRPLPANPFANLGSSQPAGQSAGQSAGQTNVFAGLKDSAPANPFAGFGNKPAAAPAAAPAKPAAAAFTPAKPFASTSAAPPTPAAPALSVAGEAQLRVRALNSKFAETVAKYAVNSVYGDWTKLCEDYIRYHKGLGSAAATTQGQKNDVQSKSDAQSQTAQNQSKNDTAEMEDVIDVVSDSDSDSEDDKPKEPVDPSITSSGFKFTGSAAGSAFSFGGKTFDHSSSTSSTSEPKTGGFKPTFDINAPKTKLPFSTGPAESKPASKPAEPAAKPGFTFGQPKPEAKEEASADKPKFVFGSGTAPFSFGNGAKPGEKAIEDQPAEPSKPAFTFGKPADKPEASEKPAFTFGKPADNADKSEKPAFTFGKPAEKDGEKPAFTFGKPDKPEASEPQKPAFTFGKPDGAEKPKFTFGQSDSGEKPKFTFGKPSEPAKFTFGANKPGFSFGAKTADKSTEGDKSADKSTEGTDGDKPKFSFGSTSWQPGQAIKFDQPIKVGSSESAETKPAETKPEGGDGDEETGDGSFHDLSGKGRGEEDEDAVYERRAKVYELKNGKYDSVGVGSMRVLVHKDSKKARLLIRADGSGRVLVNVGLHKQLAYTLEAPGQVKVVDFQGSDKPPVTYLVQVNKANGDELKDKLNEVKS